MSICSIDSSLVAVAMDNKKIIFIKVANLQLLIDRTLEFQHLCNGIACHQGNLFITTDTALYQYTVDGRLVSKLYEDTRSGLTVLACAVSPDGERIYTINQVSNQLFKLLITLSRDGTKISTLFDPALTLGGIIIPTVSPSLHVTDSGQVLVCGEWSGTIIQVDKDGRQRLTEVVTVGQRLTEVVAKKDDMKIPTCVYYSKQTEILVVGMLGGDILVFSTR